MMIIAFAVLLFSALWFFDSFEKVPAACVALVLGVPLLLTPGIALGPGLFPDYATLTRDGYLMRAAVSGVVFKTCELEVVTGFGGDAASLTNEFSAPAEFCKTAAPLLGKQVRVSANSWVAAPFREGSSNAIVQRLEPTP
jgi:hypothetical protein